MFNRILYTLFYQGSIKQGNLKFISTCTMNDEMKKSTIFFFFPSPLFSWLSDPQNSLRPSSDVVLRPCRVKGA